MHIDLAQFTEDELVALNRRIVERLHMIRSARQLVELARFSVGMTVEFTADDGRTIRGQITRLNRRTATICSAEAGHWRVSPALLRPVAGEAQHPRQPHVHPIDRRFLRGR